MATTPKDVTPLHARRAPRPVAAATPRPTVWARVAGVVLIVVTTAGVLGIPVLLAQWVGNPFTRLSSAGSLMDVAFGAVTPDVVIALIALVVWLAWAVFTLSLLVELAQALPGVRLPPITGLGWSRRGASGLLTLITVLLAGPVGAAMAADAPRAPAASAPVTARTTAPTAAATGSVATVAGAGAGAGARPDAPAAASTANVAAARTDAGGPARTVTVVAGDTLWGLAEQHLGDATRYRELLGLNVGRVQPGGRHLEADGWLAPGWVLTLPADATTAPPAADGGRTYVVERGDSLSEIAQRTLHDADRWPEIAQASADLPQPGGKRLRDPDVLAPGWTLTIPDTNTPGTDTTDASNGDADPADADPPGVSSPGPTPQPEAATPAPTSAALTPTSTPSTSVAPSPALPAPHAPATSSASAPTGMATPDAVSPSASAGAQAEATPTADGVTPPRSGATAAAGTATAASTAAEGDEHTSSTVVGVGALLAAGVLSVVAVRRRQQRRARPAGRRVPAHAATGVGWALSGRGRRRRSSDPDQAMAELQEDLEAAAAEVEAEAQLLDADHAARRLSGDTADFADTAGFAEAADPQAVLHLDVMLRLLAVAAYQDQSVMPQVHAARLDADGIELYLAHPAVLPQPWRALTDDGIGDEVDDRTGEPAVAGEAATTWGVSSTEAAQLVRAVVEAEADADATGADAEAAADGAYDDLYAEALPLRSVQAPYPTLASIGTDPDGAIVMLNLEELSSLAITGPTALAHQVLRAVAVELATSSWADDLHVTLVGDLAPELPAALGSERLSHVDDVEHLLRALEQDAHDVNALMTQHQVPDLATARAHDLDVDAWTPQLLLLSQPLDSDQHRRLQALVHQRPGVGLAAITVQGEPLGEWVLGLHARTDDAELLPGPVPLVPTRLDDTAYAEILQELHAADSRDWTPGPDWAIALTSDAPHGAPGRLLASSAAEDSTNPGDASVPSSGQDTATPADDTPHHQDAPEHIDLRDTPGRGHNAQGASDESASAEASAVPAAVQASTPGARAMQAPGGGQGELASTTWTTKTAEQILTEHTTGPVLAFMGAPLLLSARGEEPTGGDASKKTVMIAQMLYLTLMPHPSRASFTSTFWDLPIMDRGASRNCTASLSRIRRWLGTDEAGQPYVPKNQQIKLQGVVTDHDVFLELVGHDVASTPLPNLIQALQLVRGLPFEGGRSHDVRHNKAVDTPGVGVRVQVLKAHYGAWTEDLRQEVRMQIVDVALHVASVALHRGDTTTARRASAVGLRAEPHHTLLVETALRAAAAAGDEDEVNRMIIDHHLQLQADDLEPAISTLRLEADLLAALETP